MAESNEGLDDDWATALAEQSEPKPAAEAGEGGGGEGGDGSLADEWGAALAEQGATGNAEDMAAEWATMIDEGVSDDSPDLAGADRILNQEEIDQVTGFSLHELSATGAGGIRAIVDSGVVSYERLPMLEIIFDRMIRLLSTSLRNFFQDNVEVTLDNITSVRFGDYLNSIPLPVQLAVFRAEGWDNSGLVTVESNLAYSTLDLLARRQARRHGDAPRRAPVHHHRDAAHQAHGRDRARRRGAVLPAAVSRALRRRPDRDQPALRHDHAACQRGHPDRSQARHGRPRRAAADPAPLCHHRADPRSPPAKLHGREARPRRHLGRAPGDGDLAGRRDDRGGAARDQHAA